MVLSYLCLPQKYSKVKTFPHAVGFGLDLTVFYDGSSNFCILSHLLGY